MASGLLLRNHITTAKASRDEFREALDTEEWTSEDKILYIWDDISPYTNAQLNYCFKPTDLWNCSSEGYDEEEFEGVRVFVKE